MTAPRVIIVGGRVSNSVLACISVVLVLQNLVLVLTIQAILDPVRTPNLQEF